MKKLNKILWKNVLWNIFIYPCQLSGYYLFGRYKSNWKEYYRPYPRCIDKLTKEEICKKIEIRYKQALKDLCNPNNYKIGIDYIKDKLDIK